MAINVSINGINNGVMAWRSGSINMYLRKAIISNGGISSKAVSA